MVSMQIGEVAKRAGIGIETIRYYEREGLMDEPERRSSGYRQFDDAAVARLAFIVRAKELGFTLSEIKELLALWFDRNTACCDVRRRAEQKISDIEGRIQALQAMKRSLKKLIDQCQKRGTLDECPLFDGLATRKKKKG